MRIVRDRMNNGLDVVSNYYNYKKQLRDCTTTDDLLRFIAKMMIEIWYEVIAWTK